jgi:hypothetical protein
VKCYALLSKWAFASTIIQGAHRYRKSKKVWALRTKSKKSPAIRHFVNKMKKRCACMKIQEVCRRDLQVPKITFEFMRCVRRFQSRIVQAQHLVRSYLRCTEARIFTLKIIWQRTRAKHASILDQLSAPAKVAGMRRGSSQHTIRKKTKAYLQEKTDEFVSDWRTLKFSTNKERREWQENAKEAAAVRKQWEEMITHADNQEARTRARTNPMNLKLAGKLILDSAKQQRGENSKSEYECTYEGQQAHALDAYISFRRKQFRQSHVRRVSFVGLQFSKEDMKGILQDRKRLSVLLDSSGFGTARPSFVFSMYVAKLLLAICDDRGNW